MTTPASPPDLAAVIADLNTAAERIWEASHADVPGLSLEVAPHIGSTNTELMARGRRGDTSPILLVAAAQTAGRGRQGRTWQAAPGDSLTFSLGLPLRLDEVPGGGSALSLAVGLAAAQCIDQGMRSLTAAAGRSHWPPVGLKWPNDLWLQGRKLGGILIEASPAPGLQAHERWVVIGLGVNVREGAAPPGATALATVAALSTTPQQAMLTPGLVWQWIAPTLLRAVMAFPHAGFAPLQPAYAERDVLAGQQVGLWTSPETGPLSGAAPSETGTAIGVDPSGALLVHTPGVGVQSWTSGEVSVRLSGT
ncbi:MAG: biotin--[acetyl-CoA-carboxylase] ligase [Aquabacterium sp.]